VSDGMTLAHVSLSLVLASMLTLTLAMIFFAVSFAIGRGEATDGVEAAAPHTDAAQARAGSVVTTTAVRVAAPPAFGAPALPPGRRTGNIAMSLSWLTFGLLLAGVASRAVWAGRPPLGNMYEFSISTALAVLGAFLLFSLRRDVRWLGVFVTVPVLLTLGVAVTVLYSEAAELVPALRSYWLGIHVTAAMLCAGGFTLGAALTLLYLVRARAERLAGPGGAVHGRLAVRLPTAARLDGLAYRVNAFVFPLWTFAIMAGAIWAESAWGRYWGWDPKETWAFITWVIYAGYLHARATAGWRGSRASTIALIGYSAFLFNYFAVNLIFNGLHSYSGV